MRSNTWTLHPRGLRVFDEPFYIMRPFVSYSDCFYSRDYSSSSLSYSDVKWPDMRSFVFYFIYIRLTLTQRSLVVTQINRFASDLCLLPLPFGNSSDLREVWCRGPFPLIAEKSVSSCSLESRRGKEKKKKTVGWIYAAVGAYSVCPCEEAFSSLFLWLVFKEYSWNSSAGFLLPGKTFVTV